MFAREVGPLVKNKYPSIEKMQFNQILGRIWSELPPGEKNKYVLTADFQRKQQLVPPLLLACGHQGISWQTLSCCCR